MIGQYINRARLDYVTKLGQNPTKLYIGEVEYAALLDLQNSCGSMVALGIGHSVPAASGIITFNGMEVIQVKKGLYLQVGDYCYEAEEESLCENNS